MNESTTPLTDAELAAIAERPEKATPSIDEVDFSIRAIRSRVDHYCHMGSPSYSYYKAVTTDFVAVLDYLSDRESDVSALLASHAALAARLAEAHRERDFEWARSHGKTNAAEQLAASNQERDKIRATLGTMMNQADASEGRTEGALAAYRDMLHETEGKLAAAQATMERLTTALAKIGTLTGGGCYDCMMAEPSRCGRCAEIDETVEAALAPPAPEAKGAR